MSDASQTDGQACSTTLAQGFDAVSDRRARVLILGSMPGQASLQAGRYYAHPRNAFWPIMGELFGAGPGQDYEERCRRLKEAGVALWDVLRFCRRPGSLDSNIDDQSLEINDFESFFEVHDQITHVFFNGRKAEDCFRREVSCLPGLPPLVCQRLPSTSPAHAAMPFERKLRAWRSVAEVLRQPA